jgi:hypothetical protein
VVGDGQTLGGEAIVSDEAGLAVFALLRSWRHDRAAVLCAFDLLELDGEDLRRLPIEQRKRTLAKLVRGPRPGLALNKHYVGHGEIVYRQACKLGCEGIVSKRLGSTYRSGRSRQWLKVKNPAAPGAARGGGGLGTLTTAGTTRIRPRSMFRYAPDSGAKANIAGLPRWARNRRPAVQQMHRFNT